MRTIFKALSALLTYPTAELQAAIGEIGGVIAAEKTIPARVRNQLRGLLDELTAGDLYDLQERYVLLFDRTRSLSLHLFEHVHGESRDRGQAMIDLKNLYEQNGLLIGAASCRFNAEPGVPVGTARAPASCWPSRCTSCRHLPSACGGVRPAGVQRSSRRPRSRARTCRRHWRRRSRCQRPCGARCRLGGRTGPIRSRSRRRLQGQSDRAHSRRQSSGAGHARPGQQPAPSCRAPEEASCARPSTTSCSAGIPTSA